MDEDADLRDGREEDGHVHPLLDGRLVARRPGRGPRPAWLRDEVLHRGRQLGPRGQQHAGLLHPGRHQVPGLHPFAEARPVHEPARAGQRVGFLLPLARSHAPVHMALWRPRHPGVVPPHGRVQLAHLPVGQHQGRACLGQLPLRDGPRHPDLLLRGGRHLSAARISTTATRTCTTSSAATSRRGRSRCRSCRRPRRPPTGSTRST